MLELKHSIPMDSKTSGRSLPTVQDALTVRAVLCAFFIGTAVCFANTYFGLVGGNANCMPMQSALVGFALFKIVRHRLSKFLSPAEATIIEVVGSTIGLAPFPAGLTSIIPALEYLVGSVKFTGFQLLAWATATCTLGLLVAPLFRKLFLLQRNLRYPAATATGTLIGVLFGSKTAIERANRANKDVVEVEYLKTDAEIAVSTVDFDDDALSESTTLNEEAVELDSDSTDSAIRLLILCLVGSLVFSYVLYLRPSLKSIPVFGFTAKAWLWSFDMSPAYFGFGMVIGPQVHIWMLVGAVIGWGILSPLAMYKGWAQGPVDGWSHGPRGWLLWVCMGLVLGDTIVGLCWVVFRPAFTSVSKIFSSVSSKRFSKASSEECSPLMAHRPITYGGTKQPDIAVQDDDNWPIFSLVNVRSLLWLGAIILPLYLFTTTVVLHGWIPSYAVLITLLLIPLGGFISMQTLGETENPGTLAIGRAVQLIMGVTIPSSFPHHITANLLLSGVVESGSCQASQHMAQLKIAYLTQTPPKAVFYGQIIGSFTGACIATFVYRIYTSVKTIPSAEFSIPDGHMSLFATKLIYEQGLPPGVLSFAIAAFVIGVCFGVLRIMGANRPWQRFVPSGMAIALGMYIVPAITLPRAAGSMILLLCRDTFGIPSFVLICSATGLILGQGVFSVVALMFDVMRM